MKTLTHCAVLLALGVTAFSQAGAVPTDADWEWLDQNRQQVFDAVMPMHLSDGRVTYRSSRDLDVLERYFAIRSDFAGAPDSFKATVVIATGRPILKQLLDLHMKDRFAPVASMQSQLTFQRMTLESGTCRALRVQLDKLFKIRIAIASDVITLDGVLHRFVLRISDTIEATLSDERSPLVRWAVQTTDALLACPRRASRTLP